MWFGFVFHFAAGPRRGSPVLDGFCFDSCIFVFKQRLQEQEEGKACVSVPFQKNSFV